jgi:hypothetical protein
VCRLYEDLLQRAPDAAGKAFWLAMLERGASRTEVAADILGSDEYRRDVVASDYEYLFGHPADALSVVPWVAQLEGGASDRSVLAAMLGSAGYYASVGGTPADFVNNIYKLLLGRPADSTGLALWESLLSAGASRSSVALDVLSSLEYSQDFVVAQYERLLGNTPDASELSLGAATLLSGGTEESVIAGVAGSAEFYTEASQ